MKSKQCRAARALLDWDVQRLADETGLSRATIFRYESGADSLFSNVQKMRTALEKAGIGFIEDDEGIGVKLKKGA